MYNPPSSAIPAFQLGAAIAIHDDSNNATATLADNLTLNADVWHNISVSASVVAKTAIRVNTEVGSATKPPAGQHGPNQKPPAAAVAVAFSWGAMANKAHADIGAGANLQAGGDVRLTSTSLNGSSWAEFWGEDILGAFESLYHNLSNLVTHYQSEGELFVRQGEVVADEQGDIYRYIADQANLIDLNEEEFSGADWEALEGAATHLAFNVLAGSDAADPLAIENGDLVFIKPGYRGAGNTAEAGAIYRYIGDANDKLDLASTDYSNSQLWEKLAVSTDRIAAMRSVSLRDDDMVRLVAGPSSKLDGLTFTYSGSLADRDLTESNFADDSLWAAYYATVYDYEMVQDRTYDLLPGNIILSEGEL